MALFETSAALDPTRAEVYRSSRGTAYIWRPGPSLLVTRVSGVLATEAAVAVETVLRKVIAADGKLRAFHDWEAMTDYDTASRIQLTAAAREFFKVTECVHILLRSKVVAFGVQAANMVLGNIRVHTTRGEFDDALSQAMVRAR